ncbi:GNAT family N-acetyltransferase [Paenibacillus sp. FSL F4-0087]|uniref:GNAT family N-acetyltransferase n=1 Tax=Paenibacillus taichungensis TaxID=484184 RepID=A0ABX2MU71_9BACL|nr:MULTISPECIES: GNAT family N-acetyltransferase [Paenibacillus]MDR9747454.1 GNAT family N-acetyltransferase [Paenibacillus taichungensis]NUU57633.1 GNAT family N-acetyltransferase [Paenibacillus taichungensis]OME84421.1 GNAT family N-acetyltransferase [Paenibacillus pabuli]PIH58602.1 N-acetyltransferase [Paenibacillus sp. LK1]
MEIKIREIVANDYTEVVFLWNDVLEIRNVDDENFRVTIEKMNEDGNYKTFVALFENDVVGFVTIVQALSIGVSIGYLHIQALAVKKEFQHRGVGTQLLRHTENYAKELGISSIILCSGFKRTDAHAFYEHNGYDKDSYCFDKLINLG